jgi:hypothetical protein
MPPRWLSVLIIASWLLLTGWLFYDELLPRLLPGQAPAVTIDLVEEAQLRRTSLNWTAERNGQPAFTLKTRIEHPRRDTFDLVAEFPAREGGGKWEGVVTNGLRLSRLTSAYRVNAAGDLLAFEVRFTATVQFADELPADLKIPLAKEFTAAVRGEVEGGRLKLTRELPAEDGARQLSETTLAVGRGGAVLLPLHPVKRLRGLSPGQRWRTVLIDPLSYFLLPGDPPLVRARVRPKTEPFRWGRRPEAECLVIDYEGDRVKVTTWVSQDDGTVLAQEATLDGARWSLYRH